MSCLGRLAHDPNHHDSSETHNDCVSPHAQVQSAMASQPASPSARLFTPRQLQESDMATAQRTLTLQFQAAQRRAQEMAQMVPGA